jgi:DNA (cytosine-5)-methyltransferase 1
VGPSGPTWKIASWTEPHLKAELVPDERPIAVDLFGGVGGMALGFEQAGFDVVCAVEFDPAHAAAHRFNFPRCEVLQADARSLSLADLKRAVTQGLARIGRKDRRVDVVFGGPPCQGFSVGGLGDPKDPRNELVRDFARLVEGLRPRAFVLENVPAMGSRILAGTEQTVPIWLAEHMAPNYEVADPKILNASSFGVPQDRRRLLVVGVRRSEHVPEVPTETHTPRAKVPTDDENGTTALPIGPSIWDAIGDIPELEDYEELLESDSMIIPPESRKTIREAASDYAAALAGYTEDSADLSWPRTRSPSRLTSSLRTSHSKEVKGRFAAVRQGEVDAISRFYRLHARGISPTLRAGSTPDRGSYSAPRPIHPYSNRVISVREAARLHGFPDWFRFTAAKWHGFRQVGNSVCPPFAKATAVAIRAALELPALAPPKDRLSLGDSKLLTVSSGAGRRKLTTLAQRHPSESSEPMRKAA